MRIARYTLAGLLTLLLIASVAYDRWSERPYIVTGISEMNRIVSVEYTLPGGGTGERVFELEVDPRLVYYMFSDRGEVLQFYREFSWYITCYFEHVEIGQRLPPCLRSLSNGYEEWRALWPQSN